MWTEIKSQKEKLAKFAEKEKMTAMIVKMANAGESAVSIATKIGTISQDTVLRILANNGIKLKHGGQRAGAGRKSAAESVTISELMRQQAIDCATNSWEVGIGRKTLADEDWFRWAGSAFQLSAAGTYVRKESTKDLPMRLPRQLPWPRAENMDARAWDAARGGRG